jgi:hypothetical protein
MENQEGILTDYPSGKLKPQPFVQGSRKEMEEVARLVRRKFGKDFPGVVRDWEEFLNEAPQSDNAEEYVEAYPLYIPFKKLLFNIDDENFASER